jgi:2'-5' RNA ligase
LGYIIAMIRLFVALRPPAPMRTALIAAMGGIPGARWQGDDQLHITLRFIGEVDRHQAADIDAALAGVYHPPVTLRLGSLGSFDRKGRIDSLWIGLTPADAARSLHAAVDRALARVGIAPDPRAFVPHVTIARFSRGNAPAGTLPAGDLTPPPIEATFRDFHLFESQLGSEGSAYTSVERYRLEA